MVKTDILQMLGAFSEEEREFLFEMVEPALHESDVTLKAHNQEELFDVEDLEDWTNIMGRQGRRIYFMQKLFQALQENLNE